MARAQGLAQPQQSDADFGPKLRFFRPVQTLCGPTFEKLTSILAIMSEFAKYRNEDTVLQLS